MLSYCFAIAAVTVTNTLCAPAICSPCNARDSPNQLEKPGYLDTLRQGSADVTTGSSMPAETGRPRRKCCPYNFDSRLCQVVNDRVLCGYNRNIGKPENDAEPIGLSGGCRIRGGRLECGYEQGPFNNLRRPPAWNNVGDFVVSSNADSDLEDPIYYDETHDGRLLLNEKMNPKRNGSRIIKMKKEMSAVTKCVEINARIVCKQS